jgi:hypothetical protein
LEVGEVEALFEDPVGAVGEFGELADPHADRVRGSAAHREFHPAGPEQPEQRGVGESGGDAAQRGAGQVGADLPGGDPDLLVGRDGEQPPHLGQQILPHGERAQLGCGLPGGEQLGEHPLPPPDGDEPQHPPVAQPGGAHGGPPDRQHREHEQRQQDRVQHRQHPGRGGEADQVGAEFDGPVDEVLGGIDAPVAGPFHGVAPARVVEGGQVDSGGQIQQPHLGGLRDLRGQPAVGRRPGRRQHAAHGGGADEQKQRGYGGPDPFRRRSLPQQPVEDTDHTDEPDRTGHSRGELEREHGDGGPPACLPGQ